jgi:hypothetical protein
MTWKNDYAERKKARRDDLSVMEVADLQTLAELGMFQFVSSAYADRYFKKHSRWPKADVVLDLQQSAMRLAYTAQSIGLTTVYEALNDDQWLVTTKCGNTEALKELARIDKARQSAYNESRSEEKEMWSDVEDIIKEEFNASDLVADIAGSLSTRAVEEEIEDYFEKASEAAAKSIVNLILDA